MNDVISLFIVAIGCLIIGWHVSAWAISRLGRRDAWDMAVPRIGTPYPMPRSALSETDQFVARLEQQWRDRYPALQEIICYAAPEQEHEAKIYALWYAQRMMVTNPPCGVVACVATENLEIIEVD